MLGVDCPNAFWDLTSDNLNRGLSEIMGSIDGGILSEHPDHHTGINANPRGIKDGKAWFIRADSYIKIERTSRTDEPLSTQRQAVKSKALAPPGPYAIIYFLTKNLMFDWFLVIV